MKQTLLATILLALNFLSFCQNKKANEKANAKTDSIPSYIKNKHIPDFKFLLSIKDKDSVWYTNKDLPANKTVALVYFSPECGHCHHEMKEILKHIDSLQNTIFVMMSFNPLDSIKNFAESYKIKDHPNIIMGRDTKYFLPVYYSIKFTPFVALYDNQLNYVKSWDMGIDKMHEFIVLANTVVSDNNIEKKSKKKENTN